MTVARDGLRIYDQRLSLLTHSFPLRRLVQCRLQSVPRKESKIGKLILPYFVNVDVDAGDGTVVRLTFGVRSEEKAHHVEIAFQTMLAILPPSQRTKTRA